MVTLFAASLEELQLKPHQHQRLLAARAAAREARAKQVHQKEALQLDSQQRSGPSLKVFPSAPNPQI